MKKILLLCIVTLAVSFVTAGVSYVEISSLMMSYENAVSAAFGCLLQLVLLPDFTIARKQIRQSLKKAHFNNKSHPVYNKHGDFCITSM